jgi:haloacetate dehalogenase
MYEGWSRAQIPTSDPGVTINVRHAGQGPPVLLLHGNPLTLAHWHFVAPRLAEEFTVVVTDLRGYGDSSKPRGHPDHANYTFRRMAQDQVDVMRALGFDAFSVAGHDRGARTAYRMALDHLAAVRRFASIDIIPTHYALTHISREWAVNSYHWFFMAQPYDIPERLLAGNERYYIEQKLTRMGIGKGGFSPETLAEYARCCTAENLHAVCEDYRAGATLDFEMDRADWEAGRRIECPTLVVWGSQSHTEKMFDPRVAWPLYASNIVKFCPLPCGHYPAEQAPEETYRELSEFFRTRP